MYYEQFQQTLHQLSKELTMEDSSERQLLRCIEDSMRDKFLNCNENIDPQQAIAYSERSSPALSVPARLSQMQLMWSAPNESEWHKYRGSAKGHENETWSKLVSRYFEGVFDPYWASLEWTNREGRQEFRLSEPREIKLPQSMSFQGSRTLKTATAQATSLGFFEFLQRLEEYFREHNIPPSEFARRAACLLAGTHVSIKSNVHTLVQGTTNYSVEKDKWSMLRQTLLEEYAPLQWRHALVSEWLNSLTQGSKPVSLFLANARHWSTIIALMLPSPQPFPQELLATIIAAQSHPSVAANLESFSWKPGSLPDTLAVLRLAERRCKPDYNTAKAAKLDQGQGDSEPILEHPARTEQDTAVVKVMRTLGAQTNSAAIEFLKVLQHLDQAQHTETEWFSAVDECPLPSPVQVVASVKMILAELKRMRWGGTLQDVHEQAGVTHETFKTRMRNRECTMCGSAAHFFHACPQAQPYQAAFTTAARAGRQPTDEHMRSREQRYFDSAQHRTPGPHRGGGGGGPGQPPQERSPHQRARDQHIRAAGNQKFRREQRAGDAGQARRAEHSHHTEKLTHQEYSPKFLSDDDEDYSYSSDGSPVSLQRQGGSGNGRRA
jgi:hypothetical protein